MASDVPLLEVSGVAVTFGGVRALQGFNLTLPQSQVTALLGPNGAGKSTALRALSGVVKSTGSVRLRGVELMREPPYARARLGLAHVPQGRGLFSDLTVRDNLLIGLPGVHRRARLARLEESLLRFSRLRPLIQRQCGFLSGGEQQLVAVARAVITNPAVILMDEPSVGLSPKAVGDVFDTIREVASSGVSVVLVDQNARKSMALADTVLVLNQGMTVYAADVRTARAELDLVHAHLGMDVPEGSAEDP